MIFVESNASKQRCRFVRRVWFWLESCKDLCKETGCEAFNLYRLPSNDRAKLPMTDAGRDVLIPANGGKNLHLDLSRKVQP